MKELGITFQVRIQAVDESYPEDMEVTAVAEYLARKKAAAYQADLQPDEILITADTTVVMGTTLLNKPSDEKEAQDMLQLLSGKSHQVITGVCLVTKESQMSFKDITQVFFRNLSQEEINHYIRHYQPFDKAGGYAIQEWIGMIGIKKIEGSYFNVVGLPVEKLYTHLKEVLDDDPVIRPSSN